MLNALLQARNAAIVSDSTKIHTTYYGPDGESSVYVRSAAANIARTSKAANPKVVTPPPLESAKFSMGHEYALTIGEGGTVWASGRNYRGQLGNGTTIDSATPVQVVGLDDVKGVWATYTTSFAVKNDGTVWAWGENGGNVILNGPQYYSASPVQLPGLDGVDSLIVSGDTKYAKKKDGSLWAWHGAPYGHFGGPAMTEPTQMGAVTNVTKVSSHRGWTLALTADGSVWNWGTSYYGMGPRPGQYIGAATPTKVAGISGARDIFTDGNTSYVVNGDGTLWSWGMGGFGLLGTGSYESAMAPVHVAGLTDVRSVSSGPTAVKSDGTVWTWGSNGAGSLGNGTFTDSLVPVQALTSKPISKVFGYGSRFAIAIDGTLWAWGANSRGELGVETTEPAVNRPTEVPIPAGVTALTGGGESTLALTSDDGIWGWGANYFGQLGNGTTADVSGLTRRE